MIIDQQTRMDIISNLFLFCLIIIPSAADVEARSDGSILSVTAALLFLFMLIAICCWSCTAVKKLFRANNPSPTPYELQQIATINMQMQQNRPRSNISSTSSYSGYSIGPPCYSDITDNCPPTYAALFVDKQEPNQITNKSQTSSPLEVTSPSQVLSSSSPSPPPYDHNQSH